jgi:hypothetical protein
VIETLYFINFESFDQILTVPIKNITGLRLWYRVFLTNPDNYILSSDIGIVSPREEQAIRIAIRHNDSVSSFNYIKNKLQIMCILLSESVLFDDMQLKHYYIGQPIKTPYITEIPIIVDCIGFRKLNEVTLHLLRKHVKIQQYA